MIYVRSLVGADIGCDRNLILANINIKKSTKTLSYQITSNKHTCTTKLIEFIIYRFQLKGKIYKTEITSLVWILLQSTKLVKYWLLNALRKPLG